MYQYYIVEIQKYNDGTFGHLVHWASDENADKARLKAESKYYEILAAAAVSELPQHSAILFNAEGNPIMNKCYIHTAAAVAESEENSGDESEPETTEETPISDLY